MLSGYFTFGSYAIATQDSLMAHDITTGIVKALVFGAIITAVGCHEGFATGAGAEEVGRSTTSAVVISILLVIVVDLIFTTLFYVTQGGPEMSVPDGSAPVISVRDLHLSYGAREILHGLTFDIAGGETIVVIGGSGSGKSTLLRTLVGLEKPSAGEVHVRGVDITKASARAMDGIRKKIGLAFQGGALIGSLTVGENIALPLLEHTALDPTTIEVMVRIKLEQVGLSGFENYSPAQLSGGMRKRAAFARAMAMDPEILFFDEPSAGLDPITAAGIDDLILELKKAYSMTMVVVTHELASAFLIADRMILLDRGDIAAIGTTAEIRQSSHPRVRQFLDRVADTTEDDDVDHLRMFTDGLR